MNKSLMIHSGEQKESDIRLLTTKNLTTKEKLAFYEDADYCFVTKEEMLPILKMELDSIIRDGGVYYNVYNKIDDPETKIVVLFFDDFTIDLQAEIHDVKTRLSNYPVLTEFRCYASDMFEQFNARQVHSIINQTLEDHMDLDYMLKSHVITDHFPMHTKDRHAIKASWHSNKYKLTFGFIFSGFENAMQPLNFIAEYYGEKYGMYFAWLVHYTG